MSGNQPAYGPEELVTYLPPFGMTEDEVAKLAAKEKERVESVNNRQALERIAELAP